MKRHVNIPIFIPHLGCPNQCVFCNQRAITGIESFKPESVIPIIENALATVDEDAPAEIAFFGGSFTGIDKPLMTELLKIAYEYIKSGRVSSVRCSTRPDYINGEILDILSQYGVKVIELGLQSVDEGVLLASKRGHAYLDELNACRMIVERGFELVGQMMIGLPGSDLETELSTAKFIVESGAKAARIYPTVVFRETELCQMAKKGVYEPLSEDEAVSRSAKILSYFRKNGIKVIRIGLCASENLSSDESYYAGPNHPALGELVENEYYYQLIKSKIEKEGLSGADCVSIYVPKGSLSKAIGQKRKNKLRLTGDFNIGEICFFEDANLSFGNAEIRLEERKNRCI